MPELPDINAYIHALERRTVGERLLRLRVGNPFILRTAEPAIGAFEDHTVVALDRIGKRVVLKLEQSLAVVIHLMIAGRLHWKAPDAPLAGRNQLFALDFSKGTLLVTEAGTKRRASVHLVQGEAALQALDPGGIDPQQCTLELFCDVMTFENRTLKRALTDPRILSGIGNAYSDEILHAAELSPIALTRKLTDLQWRRLHQATRQVLDDWTVRLRTAAGSAFPDKVTAFRPDMAVHGRFGQPCPRCGDPVQRIRYAETETNYCARCQTGGTLLADRALSRLLGADWPKTLDQLEALKRH